MPFDGSNLTDLQMILIKARALVEDGWCQGRLHVINEADGHHTYCMTGALREAGISYPVDEAAARILHSVIQSPTTKKKISIPEWNDRKRRTHTQVLDAFDKAIVKAGLG